MEKQNFLALIDKFLAGKADPVEQQMIENYLASFQNEDIQHQNDRAERIQAILQKVLDEGRMEEKAPRRLVSFRRALPYAAALIVALGTGWWLLQRNNTPTVTTPVLAQVEIKPGGNGAILELENGESVSLDSTSHSNIQLNQHGAQAIAGNGMLRYDGTAQHGQAGFNKVTTPKGMQFKLQLPDGTVVHLNAASSIRFPTTFDNNERRVQVTGEAFFKVTNDAAKPFVVSTRYQQEIKVLGTEFNINAYDDEPFVRTTLISGKVMVQHQATTQSSVILQPGQEAQNGGSTIVVQKDVDIEQSTAWLNNMFTFNKADIKTVMRQIGRWYNVDVVFDKDIHTSFSGSLYRSGNINDLLDAIAYSSNLSYSWEGRTLHLQPSEQ
ncbi:FecR family protein [Chitinophaga skermanii]|uniref:FecR family protein n=1 Tax=Chitinophaga skermanii TaxID=331697 RepID=A0A327QR14_9BACT|nr:FecR domain-containing protein [Chitinophaga skermanii]RAJ06468.1 FecR family protein [Chitinophaga skermanii]